MDWFILTLIASFVVILFAVIWNATIGKDKTLPATKPANDIFSKFNLKYQFKEENDSSSGYFNSRKVILTQNPLMATIELENAKNINLLIEKGFSTQMDFLITTPIQGAEEFQIKSNYPMLAAQIMSEDIINELKSVELFSIILEQNLKVRFGEVGSVKDVERLLMIAISLTKDIEAINYAYEQ